MNTDLMNNINSDSENVKRVFRVTMQDRTKLLLASMKFTNDELLEIISLTKLETNHPHEFYAHLVNSQSGPFSDEVFGEILPYCNYTPGILNTLMKKSGELSEKNKVSWLIIAIKDVKRMPTNLKEVGIDSFIYPYNVAAATVFIMNYKTFKTSLIFSLLDSMTEDQMIETYKQATKIPENISVTFDVFTQYSKTPTEIIDMLFVYYKNLGSKGFSKVIVLVKMDNASDVIKSYVYEKTGNDAYMPECVKEIFFF
jgi:hypothetical protein